MINLQEILTKQLLSFTEKDWPNKLYIAQTPLPPDLNNTYSIPEVFRIYICTSGNERMKIPTPNGYKTVPLTAGEALLAFPGCTITLQSNGRESFQTLGLFFNENSIEIVKNDNTSWPYHHTRFNYPCSGKLVKEKDLIDHCLKLLTESGETEADILKTKVNSVRLIFSLLTRMFNQPYYNSFSSTQKKDIALQNMLFYIKSQANKPLKRSDIAKEFNLSTNSITNFFHNNFNTTFKSYLTNLKMQHACRMLLSTDLKIKDISKLVGYSFPESFIQKFTLFFKISPKQLKSFIQTAIPEHNNNSFTLPLLTKQELEKANISYLKNTKRRAIKTHIFNLSEKMVQIFILRKGYIHFNSGKILAKDMLSIDCNAQDIIIVKELDGDIIGFYKNSDHSSIALFSIPKDKTNEST